MSRRTWLDEHPEADAETPSITRLEGSRWCGGRLRLETLVPVLVHWSADSWQTTGDASSWSTGLGVHVVDLPTDTLPVGTRVDFTFFWPEASRWEQHDYFVVVTI